MSLLPTSPQRTLDLGCGEGRLARELKRLGHNVVGIDAAPSMIRLARELDPCGEYLVADAAQLPFSDASFELVVAFISLMDIDDMPGAPFTIRGSYFRKRWWEDRIERDGLRVHLLGRAYPLEAYASALEQTELLIEAIREPLPSEELARRLPGYERWRRVPLFLHIRAVKA